MPNGVESNYRARPMWRALRPTSMRARAGDFIFVAGQVARDENNEWVGIGDAGRRPAGLPQHRAGSGAHGRDAHRRRQDQHDPGRPQRSRRGHGRPPRSSSATTARRTRAIIVFGLGSPEVKVEVEVIAYLPARRLTDGRSFLRSRQAVSIARKAEIDAAIHRVLCQRPPRLGRRGAGLRGGVRRLERRPPRGHGGIGHGRAQDRASGARYRTRRRGRSPFPTPTSRVPRPSASPAPTSSGSTWSRSAEPWMSPQSRRPSRRAPAPSCRSIFSVTPPISGIIAIARQARPCRRRGCMHRARRDNRRAKGRHFLRRDMLQLRADEASGRFRQRRRLPDRGRRHSPSACARSPATGRRARDTAPIHAGGIPQGLHHETDGTQRTARRDPGRRPARETSGSRRTLAVRREQAARYEEQTARRPVDTPQAMRKRACLAQLRDRDR